MELKHKSAGFKFPPSPVKLDAQEILKTLSNIKAGTEKVPKDKVLKKHAIPYDPTGKHPEGKSYPTALAEHLTRSDVALILKVIIDIPEMQKSFHNIPRDSKRQAWIKKHFPSLAKRLYEEIKIDFTLKIVENVRDYIYKVLLVEEEPETS